jgi:tape measure domain-containing protein
MVKIRELTFDVLFKDRATKALKRADKATDRLKKGTRKLRGESRQLQMQQKSLARSSEGLAGSLKQLGSIAAVGLVVNQIRRLGTEAVTTAIAFEQTEISFEVLLGSAEKGRKMLQRLEDFSLATPFEPGPIIKAGKALLAARRPTEGITDDLKKLGDVAAISGVPIQDLTNIYAKVFSKGKAQTEELLQVAERGIPILDTLKTVMGVETTEQILKMGEKGQITFDKFNEAFTLMTGKGGDFENGMARLALTAGGLLSTFFGFKDILMRTIGKESLEPLKELTREMIEMSKASLEWLKVTENSEFIRDFFRDLATTLSGILKLTGFIVRNLAKFQQFKGAFGKTAFGKFVKPLTLGVSPGQQLAQLGRIGQGFGGGVAPVAAPAAAVAPAGATAGGGGVTQINQIEINERIEDVPAKLREVVIETLDDTVPVLEAQFAK